MINRLKPGSVPKVHTNGKKFKIMENMENFQKAIKKYGVPDVDVFQTVDLYEKRNIPQVVHSIRSLGRAVSWYSVKLTNNFKFNIRTDKSWSEGQLYIVSIMIKVRTVNLCWLMY